jgi:cation diffusion facilitator CzcD-associated flavoprotein CzcO
VPIATGPAYQRLEKRSYIEHPNKHFITREPRSIGIVGAGSAGLAAAKTLSQQGFAVDILEKGSKFGGVWADNYQDAALQGPYPHFNIPDFPFPNGSPIIPKRHQVWSYLESYAQAFDLNKLIQLNSEVTAVAQGEDGSWTVALKNGGKKHYDFLVLSTGQFHRPFIPAVPGLTSFAGKALHAFEVRNAAELFAGKKVIIVGGGKSACDMITLAAKHQGSVTAIMRHQEWAFPLELNLLGRPVIDWANCKLGQWLNPMPYEPNTWTNWALKQIGSIYWRMIADTLLADSPDSMKPKTDLRREKNKGTDIRDPELVNRVRKGEVAVVTGTIEQLTPQGALVNGSLIPADVIVFATGFKSTTFGLAGQEEAFWLYRGVLDPHIRNLAFIGYGNFNFNQLKFSLQTAWLCDMLRGGISLPSTEAMKAETQDYQAAMREAYGPEAHRYAYAWSEFRYYDKLLSDMKVQSRRKSTIYEDLMAAPDPLDYKLVITHRV